ncbi:MAG: alpha/beta hydrolase [Alphaproteobacteria bacterium]|nr:alpha/beta hydrolase [Alphaproteobacteria bacterium]
MSERRSQAANIAPKGDGHPVLVIPGFFLNDMYMSSLRKTITAQGYKAYEWGGGFNVGLNKKTAIHLRDRLHQIYAENGHQPVSIVGYSLGGIYARELAREFPDMVRCAVTLGCPFGNIKEGSTVFKVLRSAYTALNKTMAHCLTDDEIAQRFLTPPPVPTTSVYCKGDRVANWRTSLNPPASETENIEVQMDAISPHMSIPRDPMAVAAVLDRLAQKVGQWKPFNRKTYEACDKAQGACEDVALPDNPAWQDRHSQHQPFFKGSY